MVHDTRIWQEAGEVSDVKVKFQGQQVLIRAQRAEDEDVLLLHLKTHQPIPPPYLNVGGNKQVHLGKPWHRKW